MSNNDFIFDTRQRINKDFVFISYSHENKQINERVSKLVNYLTHHNVNVVYDHGSLPSGTNGYRFMENIVHPNRKYALLVCDESYYRKTLGSSSGVSSEYDYLLGGIDKSTDREMYMSRIIPMIAEEGNRKNEYVPKIVSNSTYISFLDETMDTFEQIYCIVKECIWITDNNYTQKELKIKAHNKYVSADRLCENGDYNAARSDINTAIDLYSKVKTKNKLDYASYYNMAANIELRDSERRDFLKARQMCVSALKCLDEVDCKDFNKYAVYTLNLALSYNDGVSFLEYEDNTRKAMEYAELIYEIDKNIDMPHYWSAYSEALYFQKKYTDAYLYEKAAYDEVKKRNKLYTRQGIKIVWNLAEMTLFKNLRRKEDRLNNLLEAEGYVREALVIFDMFQKEFIDREKQEAYKIACLVYESLSSFYRGTTV